MAIQNPFDHPLVLREEFYDRLVRDEELPARSHSVAWRILYRVNHKKGYSYPGHEGIAAELGVDVRTVRRCVEELEERGWFRCERRKGCTIRYYPNYERAGLSRVSSEPKTFSVADEDNFVQTLRSEMSYEPTKEPTNKPLRNNPAAPASPFVVGEPGAAPDRRPLDGSVWWEHISEIRNQVSPEMFERCIDPLTPEHDTGEILMLMAPSEHIRLEAILKRGLLGQIVGRKVNIRYTAAGHAAWAERKRQRNTPPT